MRVERLKEKFIEIYGGDIGGIRVFRAPGRVNLIGEHTDYNGGYVFPAALSMSSTVVCRINGENLFRLKATDLNDFVEGHINNIDNYKDLKWGNYQLGVAAELMKNGYPTVGMDMLYHDTVPHGSGLSSSAAVEIATACAIATVGADARGKKAELDMVELAKIGQSTEHNYCGVKCGIMDQFASAMGKKDNAIFINCRTLEFEHIPLVLSGYKLVLSNTKVKRSLAVSKYNERRAECESGLACLQQALPEKTCLGEISFDEFLDHASLIKDDIVKKRVKHIITENDRVLKSVSALKRGDITEFGGLINESGDSLRYDYEVTGAELDAMTEAARKISGTIGSRMTGAGFGGCTVSIVKEDDVDEFIEEVGGMYRDKTGIEGEFYISETDDGGREI